MGQLSRTKRLIGWTRTREAGESRQRSLAASTVSSPGPHVGVMLCTAGYYFHLFAIREMPSLLNLLLCFIYYVVFFLQVLYDF